MAMNKVTSSLSEQLPLGNIGFAGISKLKSIDGIRGNLRELNRMPFGNA